MSKFYYDKTHLHYTLTVLFIYILEKDKKSIAENLIGWSQKIASDRETMSGFICGSYTSHVARSYFQALAGIYFPSETDEKNMMYKQNICKFEK